MKKEGDICKVFNNQEQSFSEELHVANVHNHRRRIHMTIPSAKFISDRTANISAIKKVSLIDFENGHSDHESFKECFTI